MQETLAPGPRVQTSGNKYRSQLRALRALDQTEPGKAIGNKTYRQARYHPYNVKQLPEEYAAPWGWRHGKAVRAIAPDAERLVPIGFFLPPPPPPHVPAPSSAPLPLPLPPLYLPQPGPVAPEPIARAPAPAPVPAPAQAPAQPTPPPRVRPEPAWLQQLKMDAQNRQALDVFGGMWAEMQLRLELKNILEKAEALKRAVPELSSATEAQPVAEVNLAPERNPPAQLKPAPEQQPAAQLKPTVERNPAAELQSATKPQPQPQPTIVERPTPKPLPKRLTDEEMARYLDLVEENEEWVLLGLPIQQQRERWEKNAHTQDPEYIRCVIRALAVRLCVSFLLIIRAIWGLSISGTVPI